MKLNPFRPANRWAPGRASTPKIVYGWPSEALRDADVDFLEDESHLLSLDIGLDSSCTVTMQIRDPNLRIWSATFTEVADLLIDGQLTTDFSDHGGVLIYDVATIDSKPPLGGGLIVYTLLTKLATITLSSQPVRLVVQDS